MGLEQSPTPITRTSSLNATLMARVCSKRFCPNIIKGSFKGNICDQCTMSREEILESVHANRAVAKVKIPSSVLAQVMVEAPFRSSESQTFIEQESKNIRRKRPHITISQSQTAESYVYNHFNSWGELILPHPSPANNGGNGSGRSRLCQNCSSRSSLIGERCSNCRPTSTVNIKPIIAAPLIFGLDKSIPQPTSNAPCSAPDSTPQTPSTSKDILPIILDVNKMEIDAEGDADLDDLELSYPDPSVITPPIYRSYTGFCSDRWNPRNKAANLPPRPHPQPGVIIRPPGWVPSYLSDNVPVSKVDSAPTKRQKLSHSVIENVSPSSSEAKFLPWASQPLNAATEPKTARSSINSARSLKLCSTGDCTGIVSSGSSATRCLSCVRRDWKMKRELAAATPVTSGIRDVGDRKQDSSRLVDASGRVTKKAKKKGVTWADDVVQHHSSPPTPNYSISPTDKPKTLETSTPHDETLNNNNTLKLEDFMNLDGLVEADYGTPQKSAKTLEMDEASVNRDFQGSPGRDVRSENLPGLNSDFNAEYSITQGSMNKAEDCLPNEEHIPGWDSDLSDLTESHTGDSDSGSPTNQKAKSSHLSIPSGLKIRIPARPAGAHTIKCASRKCDQLLEIGYRWKSCVMCRTRRRDFHRKKHNIEARYKGLLEELTEAENMGTPLAMDLHKHTGAVKLVPGARLCAVKNCTYIIPPVDEYSGKICTFCRLRRTEREHLEEEIGKHPSRRSKLVSHPSFWLQQLDHDRTNSRDGSGRCRRHGCGMLLSSSSLRECKQCTARRHWLTNQVSANQSRADGPVLLHRGSRKPLYRPRGPAPYPKYKCFSAVLLEFKGRLAGFLRAQSIFFLFHQPRSANALFAFDGEYSTVALDFDIDKHREEVDANVLKLKREIEYVGRIKFSPKRSVSILEEGGIAVRFSCMYPVPMMQPKTKDGQTTISSFATVMQCELEIAVVPDHSHRFIPGKRTIVRFRLFG